MSQKAKLVELPNYNFAIQGKNFQVTEPIKEYILDKLVRLERFSTRIVDVVVTLEVQKIEHRADVVMKFNNIKVKAQGSSDDMYVSIDMAIHKLEAQLRRYKGKIQAHQAKGHAVIEMNVNVLRRPSEEPDSEAFIEEAITAYPIHEIVRRETRALKTLTYDEAVMKMELSHDNFLIFRSEENRKIKVIYRTSDGNYGIIEPE